MATNNATNTDITVSAAGAINYPVQPAFFAYKSSSTGNVTGDGTVYTIVCDTSVYNVSTSYSTVSGLFTAPVDGNYMFTCGVEISTIGVSNNALVELVVNGITIRMFQFSPLAIAVGGVAAFSGSAFYSMTAGSTAAFHITCSGTTKTVGVDGQATNPLTWFSGMLVC